MNMTLILHQSHPLHSSFTDRPFWQTTPLPTTRKKKPWETSPSGLCKGVSMATKHNITTKSNSYWLSIYKKKKRKIAPTSQGFSFNGNPSRPKIKNLKRNRKINTGRKIHGVVTRVKYNYLCLGRPYCLNVHFFVVSIKLVSYLRLL